METCVAHRAPLYSRGTDLAPCSSEQGWGRALCCGAASVTALPRLGLAPGLFAVGRSCKRPPVPTPACPPHPPKPMRNQLPFSSPPQPSPHADELPWQSRGAAPQLPRAPAGLTCMEASSLPPRPQPLGAGGAKPGAAAGHRARFPPCPPRTKPGSWRCDGQCSPGAR